MSFDSPGMLLAALGLALLAGFATMVRRPALPKLSFALLGLGLLFLALAGGGANWRRGAGGEVVVMVDLSASTRTAAYRDRAFLSRRIHELLGRTPYRILLFAQDNRADNGGPLVDLPCQRTIFAPPPADAILLFSDARFEIPPAGPRTYVVIDPALEQPIEAAVTKLELRGRDLAAQVTVTGAGRELSLGGTAATQPVRIEPGSLTLGWPLKDGAASASAQFSAGDAWPENDGLWIDIPPTEQNERWWVGPAPLPGWRAIEATGLPVERGQYLAPAVIVLNNIPAAALSEVQQQRLQQYVRDLGGAMVILGGDRAFAAGDYAASALESVSPLAGFPPQPAMQWIVLVDGSGSMGQTTPEGTRWQLATSAVIKLLPHLPPEDIAILGSFAENITWWSAGKSIRETMSLPLPPNDLSPRGPTNLQTAIGDVTHSAQGAMPKQLMILTDADAQIDDPAALAAEMKARHLRLHVLAIGSGFGLPALRQIATVTGGTLASATDAKSWTAALQDLSRGAMPRGVETAPLPVRFLPPLRLPNRDVEPWNRTWLKSMATALAQARAGDELTHPVARWNVGTGEVIAAGFAATPREAAALADLIARPPRDPRFRIVWDAGAKLRVTVDAVEGKHYLNALALTLELRGADAASTLRAQAIPQTAPGRYELSLPAPRAPMFAAVRHEGRLLDQTTVAGRYPPEFDGIGNDHDAMHELARRTGGDVIDVRQTKPIDFPWPRRDLPLGSWLAAAAALLIAAGLAWWRMLGGWT